MNLVWRHVEKTLVQKARAVYSLLPFAATLMFLTITENSQWVIGNTNVIIGIFIVFTPATFLILSALHIAILEYEPWNRRSKLFRLFWVLSVFWVLGVLLFVVLFDPYGSRLSKMGNYDYMQVLSTMFVVPAFVGLAAYVYQRYIK